MPSSDIFLLLSHFLRSSAPSSIFFPFKAFLCPSRLFLETLSDSFYGDRKEKKENSPLNFFSSEGQESEQPFWSVLVFQKCKSGPQTLASAEEKLENSAVFGPDVAAATTSPRRCQRTGEGREKGNASHFGFPARQSRCHEKVKKSCVCLKKLYRRRGKTDGVRAAPVKPPPAARGKTGGQTLQFGSYFPARHTPPQRMFFLVMRPAVLGVGV